MNELYDNKEKRLPYHEMQEYVDGLIDRTTQQAIERGHKRSGSRNWRMAAAAAAVVVIALGIGLTVVNHTSEQTVDVVSGEGPFDEFLNTLTDEEVAQLPYYEIEEIPEY